MKYFASYITLLIILSTVLGVKPVGAEPFDSRTYPESYGPAWSTPSIPTNDKCTQPLGCIKQVLDTVGQDAFGVGNPNALVLIGKLINVGLGLLSVVFLILMLYGGYLWMTAMGDQERITKAKETIVPAVIGILIIVGAYAITDFVVKGLVTASTQ